MFSSNRQYQIQSPGYHASQSTYESTEIINQLSNLTNININNNKVIPDPCEYIRSLDKDTPHSERGARTDVYLRQSGSTLYQRWFDYTLSCLWWWTSFCSQAKPSLQLPAMPPSIPWFLYSQIMRPISQASDSVLVSSFSSLIYIWGRIKS